MERKHNPKESLPQPSPYLAESAPIHIGDVVVYRSYPMKVWTMLNMSVGLHPGQAPGVYYVLKGNGMHPHAYFIVPASDVERPQTVVA